MSTLTYDILYTISQWILHYPTQTSPYATPTSSAPIHSITTLLAFSKTCRLFNEAATPVLYSDISLRRASQPELLLRTLTSEDGKELKSYIKTLRICMKSYSYIKENRIAWEKSAALVDLLTTTTTCNDSSEGLGQCGLRSLHISFMPSYCSRDLLGVLNRLSSRPNTLRNLAVSSPYPSDEAGYFFRWTWEGVETLLFPPVATKTYAQLGHTLESLTLDGTSLSQQGKWQSKEWVIKPDDSLALQTGMGSTLLRLGVAYGGMANLRTLKLSQCVLPCSLLSYLLLNTPQLQQLVINRPTRLTKAGLYRALCSVQPSFIRHFSLTIADSSDWGDSMSSPTNLLFDGLPYVEFLHLNGPSLSYPSILEDILQTRGLLKNVVLEGFQRDLEPGKMLEDLRECFRHSECALRTIRMRPNVGWHDDVKWSEAQVERLGRAWKKAGVIMHYVG